MGLDGVKDLEAYEYVSSQRLENLKSEGMILKHKKSGARICLISNDDENKVFYIGFRTPPVDSTGLQHIMEHSVLCGSKKYPVKDPFIELAKGSLNTFLNAMTYPDKTVYPVASCNDKDFQNLMNVYLDAVFYPNIYTREQIFKQEGWHYELKDATDPVTINGVVYNEMKGVYSSADDVLEREIISSLFPDSVYSNESGGDPKVIPTLTYDKFIEYHRNFYHPCNSYIYLYGNMDMAEKLEFIDREYLRDYDVIDLDTAIELQKPFSSMNRVTKYYPVTDDDEQTDGTYLSYNTVIDTVLDRELYLAFQIIEYSLLTAPGAVLKQKLLDKGIGEDIYGSYDNGIYQPYFTVVSKNANEEDAENFLNTIKDVLSQVVKEGLDKKSLRAGLNVLEFRYRENDFGGYPKGLVYGLEALDSWLYDENHPFMHIEILDVFEKLKGLVDTDYFEKLIDKYLLNNSHSSFVVLRPKAGLQDEIDEQLTKELEAYKAQLSEAQINELVESTKELIAYQEEPSTGEELETIPLLEISDIKESIIPFKNTLNMVEDTKVLTHDIFTNGIGYLTLGFDCDNISTELLPYLALLSNILGLIDTENYSYADLTSEIFLNSGGIDFVNLFKLILFLLVLFDLFKEFELNILCNLSLCLVGLSSIELKFLLFLFLGFFLPLNPSYSPFDSFSSFDMYSLILFIMYLSFNSSF